MEHVESYRDRRFWAWKERDAISWTSCLALKGTLETGLGREHKDGAQVLKAVVEVVRTRLEVLFCAAGVGVPP